MKVCPIVKSTGGSTSLKRGPSEEGCVPAWVLGHHPHPPVTPGSVNLSVARWGTPSCIGGVGWWGWGTGPRPAAQLRSTKRAYTTGTFDSLKRGGGTGYTGVCEHLIDGGGEHWITGALQPKMTGGSGKLRPGVVTGGWGCLL
eukprot:754828-Hanusia_phi.AAC.1